MGSKKNKKKVEETSAWDKLAEHVEGKRSELIPRVSVVVITHNCSQSIALTLESIVSQAYEDLEIIVVDANSTDRTLEIVNNFQEYITRVYSVAEYHIYEMMNRGISLASGFYINFLFPGDYYISSETLNYITNVAMENDTPDLVYCACLLRDGRSEPRILHRPLSRDFLRKGKQPTSLEACFFRIDTLIDLGKFPSNYQLRGGFDILCRLNEKEDLKIATTNRVFLDYDRRFVTYKTLIEHSRETLYVIYKYFGFRAAFSWWFLQNHFRFMKWWFSNLKTAFLGR